MEQHFYKAGDNVVVWNQTLSGRTFCEGRAKIVRPINGDHRYLVRFGDEVVERTVEPDAADMPDQPESERITVSLGTALSRDLPAA